LMLIYTHEKSTESRQARDAFEVQRDKNKSTREQAWQEGFIVGANVSLNTVGEAMMHASELNTNANEFVRSNILWSFNLQRPK